MYVRLKQHCGFFPQYKKRNGGPGSSGGRSIDYNITNPYNPFQLSRFQELIERREEALKLERLYSFESFAEVKITLEIAGHAAG